MGDTRILHVPSTYGDYSNLSVSAAFEKIQKEITQKFKNIAAKGVGTNGSGSVEGARKLQEFFQLLKKVSESRGKGLSDESLIDSAKLEVVNQVLTIFRQNNKVGPHGGQITQIFTTRGEKQGETFEKEVSFVLSTVQSLAANNGLNKSQLIANATSAWLGQAKTNIGGKTKAELNTIINETAKQVMGDLNANAAGRFKKRVTKSGLDSLVTTQVDNKIDVSGLAFEWNISVTASPYLQEIAGLLSQASFTLKSYSSLSWQKDIQQQIESKYTTLHLGKTNQGRIFIDLFLTQVPLPVAMSMYMYLINTPNQKIKQQGAQLRMLYELTGYGQTLVDQIIRDQLNKDGLAYANYIIYNDPATDNIYVQSTAQLWLEMRKYAADVVDRAAINVPKKWFI